MQWLGRTRDNQINENSSAKSIVRREKVYIARLLTCMEVFSLREHLMSFSLCSRTAAVRERGVLRVVVVLV